MIRIGTNPHVFPSKYDERFDWIGFFPETGANTMIVFYGVDHNDEDRLTPDRDYDRAALAQFEMMLEALVAGGCTVSEVITLTGPQRNELTRGRGEDDHPWTPHGAAFLKTVKIVTFDMA